MTHVGGTPTRTLAAWAALATGRDLVADPGKAKEPEVAAQIMVKGMVSGRFTGKKLSDYTDYLNMRRTVNGTDRAAEIAELAYRFETALTAIPALDLSSPPPVPPLEPWRPSIQQTMLGLIGAAIAAVAAYWGWG